MVAFVESPVDAGGDGALGVDAVMAAAAGALSWFEVPHRVVVVDGAFPTSAHDKVDGKALMALIGDEVGGSDSGDRVSMLTAAIARVLPGGDAPDGATYFLALGGTSVDAVAVAGTVFGSGDGATGDDDAETTLVRLLLNHPLSDAIAFVATGRADHGDGKSKLRGRAAGDGSDDVAVRAKRARPSVGGGDWWQSRQGRGSRTVRCHV